MDFNDYIGKNKEFVTQNLQKMGYEVLAKDNNSGSNDFDTELVVRINKIDKNCVEIITSKFLTKI